MLAHRKAINTRKWTRGRLEGILVAALAMGILMIMPSIGYSQDESDTEGALYRLIFDREDVVLPCAKGCKAQRADSQCSPDSSPEVEVRLEPTELMEDTGDVWFEFIPDIGEVLENRGVVIWRITGDGNGKFWLKVKINQGFETVDVVQKSIELTPCDCTCKIRCAEFKAAASARRAGENEIVLFRLKQTGVFVAPRSKHAHRFEWSVENGEIISGQGTHILKVRAGASSIGPLRVTVRATRDPQDDCPGIFELEVPIEAPKN